MEASLAPRERRLTLPDVRLHVREWDAEGRPFLLVHGLASNARTWDDVARRLNAAGHRVVALDQRGHGRSDKPPSGYGFDQVAADLHNLAQALDMPRPFLVGQSWGGNVVLDFARRYPQATSGLVLVDGGFLELAARPGATWEDTERELRPPPLAGTPRRAMAERIRAAYPDWSAVGIEGTLGNFETMPDGTVRPWLTLERHMEILRALWDHRPSTIYSQVTAPVLIAVAGAPSDKAWDKRQPVAAAEAGIPQVRVQWFEESAHDLHVHRPAELTTFIFQAFADGFFS